MFGVSGWCAVPTAAVLAVKDDRGFEVEHDGVGVELAA
jgi:hypothetical protein